MLKLYDSGQKSLPLWNYCFYSTWPRSNETNTVPILTLSRAGIHVPLRMSCCEISVCTTRAKGKNIKPVDPWSRTYLKVGACSMGMISLIYSIRKTKELVQSIDWRKSQKLDEWTDWIFISVSRKFTLSLYQKICQSIVPYGHAFYRTYWEKILSSTTERSEDVSSNESPLIKVSYLGYLNYKQHQTFSHQVPIVQSCSNS